MKKVITRYFAVIIALGCIISQSCTSKIYLTQRTSYRIDNRDGEGCTDQNSFSVKYPKFSIHYTANGGCWVMNTSDSMMYVDMSASHFIYNGIESKLLYNNEVHTQIQANTVENSLGRKESRYSAIGQFESNYSSSQTNANIVQSQDERVVTIPPHTRKNLRFYPLQSTSVTEIVNGKTMFKKSGSIENFQQEYEDLNGHIMTYRFGFNQEKNTRNTFTIQKNEILNTTPQNNSPAVKLYTYEAGIKFSCIKTAALMVPVVFFAAVSLMFH
ncbi:MAG: hypothetical protein K6E93_01080 [Bacteroidales bacterium]|nr:hypothetical protein [Bacteroidales bacterium]